MKRTSLKRTPLRARPMKRWKLELDRLCREVVFLRDGNRCVRCGARDRLQWAHVRTRAHLSFRWILDGSMVLCAGCHLTFWHHKPLEATRWWSSTYPDRAQRMMLRASFRPSKIDPEAIRILLEQEREKLLGGPL